MSYMEIVAKTLRVELGEYFEVYRYDGLYCLTHSGLLHVQSGLTADKMLRELLSGECHIKHKPWKPSYGDIFWMVGQDGDAICNKWRQYTEQVSLYKIGNCYKTEADAKANRDKWIAFYASDEALEV